MMKKVFSIITLFVLLLTLGACGDSKKIRVTFESNGGSSIGAIILSEPKEIAEFDDPVKEGYFSPDGLLTKNSQNHLTLQQNFRINQTLCWLDATGSG